MCVFLASQVGKLKLMTCKNNKNSHVKEEVRERQKEREVESGKTGDNFSNHWGETKKSTR